MAEEEKDDWLDDLDDDDGASELDQSDIESLLSGDSDESALEVDSATEDPPDEDAGEIDSADIDSLLSGTDDDAPQEEAAPEAPEEAEAATGEIPDDSDIGQSDIDALLSETDGSGDGGDSEDPDQSEIDMLFSEVDEGDAPEADPFQAEEIDFKDVIDSDQGDDESFMDGTGTAFDAEEFGIDDEMSDIPDLGDMDSGDDDSTTGLFDDTAQATEVPDEATVLMGSDEPGKASGGLSEKIAIILAGMPPALQERKNQGIIGGCLVLLILAGVFLFGGDKEDTEEVAEQAVQEQQAPTTPPVQAQPEVPNAPPLVKDSEFTMTQGSNELAIVLTAEDAEGDTLSYEVLSLPVYGKLSGQAPGLIYIPGKDFAGQDSFMFRVSDGKNISQPANVKISAPLIQVAKPEQAAPVAPKKPAKATKKQTYKPKKLVIAAKNKSYQLASTSDLLIDWEELWNSANYLPFTKKVKVEIISSNLHGKLKKLGNSQSLYVPDKYFGGKENLKYRFKLGKTSSKVRNLKINVKMGSPAPTIQLAKMAKTYTPGETVVLDAQNSRDENRDTVKFTWQQVSGVPVQLEVLNEEESQVAFVVPSSFNTVANPGPVLRLTATDEDGQNDVRDIKVATRSRRPTAMWRGLAGGGIADDPACPYENCPGGLLPWPYSD